MASNRSQLNILLTLVSAIVLSLMIYINIHATRHNFVADISHGSFLRMLEESVDYSSGGDGGGDSSSIGHISDVSIESDEAGLEEMDELKIDKLAKSISNLQEIADGLEDKLHLLAGKAKHEQGTIDDVVNEEEKINTDEKTAEGEPPLQQQEKTLTGMNILLLYADDWTHSTLSAFHKTKPLNTVLKTPVLDALASDGIRFTHNCVTTSVCWISRATLYTGQYMSRHKTKEPCCWSGGKKPKQKLKEAPANWKELSFYEILADHGYHVGHAGKWGVYLPFEKNVHFNVEDDGWHYRKIGGKMWHITEKNEADALRFLVTRPKDKPFMLNAAFYATHAKDGDIRQYMPQNSSMGWYADDTIPIPPTGTDEAWKKMPYFFNAKNEGRARWRWRYDNYTKHQTMMKNYYRMASEVDAACGAILEELRRQDALDNTVIIFTTDNGNYHSEHGLADKWYPHQESIRVPLIIRDPRMKDEIKGTTNDDFTLNIDLAPTILGAAGIPSPEKMMGRDMSPLYLSPTSPTWREEFFYEHPIISNKNYIPSSEALVRKDYKYMYWPDFKYEQLFDLVNDPGELEDIFNSTNPDIMNIKKDMKKSFDWLKSLVKSEGVVKV
ncbi:hypothetical protein ACHAXR_006671 [Thalassiosira sp. AJA248-18]